MEPMHDLLPTRLLLIDLDDVVLLHFELLRRLVIVDTTAVEEETERVDGHAYALGIRFFQLAHLGGHLDAIKMLKFEISCKHLKLSEILIETSSNF